MSRRSASRRVPRNFVASPPRRSSACATLCAMEFMARKTSLNTFAKAPAWMRDNPRQPDERVHAPGEQRQAQAFQPSGAVAVAISVREAIRILAVLALAVKSRREVL